MLLNKWLPAFLVFRFLGIGFAATFVHPGGLHTMADLERMKTNVLAGNHPWIDGWQQLLRDPQAQSTWKPAARANLGVSRQRADADAHAAYLNALRWYISGDTNYAECSVRICNAWSAAVNQVPTGQDLPGLSGIPIFDFALAGELLRIYPGWRAADFNRFTKMMTQFFYPVCHDFLMHHNGQCPSFYWANWDACNLGALMAMGVLCDNTNYFQEGVEYFKHGPGMGSISNAIPFLYDGNLGQWQESGRDQEHAQLGVGLFGSACQVAWNQGVDLFGYADNRLLAGAEYVAKCNLSHPPATIPYTFYNNCSEARQFYISRDYLGRLDDRPVYELIYNHYAVLRGLPAPYSKAMAELMRPEHGSGDHFGYGTLTFTVNAAASPYPPHPIPPAPKELTAEAGAARVFLNWTKSDDDTVQGYVVRRSTNADGPFTTIASWSANSAPQFTDNSVSNGVTYYYDVAAQNQSGVSANSDSVRAMAAAAGPLPAEWSAADIGAVGRASGAMFAAVSGNTFIAKGAGGDVGGRSDAFNFTHRAVKGDLIFTARLLDVQWNGREKIGLMIRESSAPDARMVSLTVGEVGNRQCRWGTRAEPSGRINWQAGNDYTRLPAWFKIQRAGDVFTGYQSVDGTNWFKVGSSTVTMTNQDLAGLVVTSGKKDAFDTAVFDHVAVQTTSK